MSNFRVNSNTLMQNLLRILLPILYRQNRKVDSGIFWESKYRKGETSGPGSYGRLAHFKADFLNDFVDQHTVKSVIDFGSGDGGQLALASYPSYIGVDVSETAVRSCRVKFAERPEYRFYTTADFDVTRTAELALSLDVIYHLVEDDVFDKYMHRLFDAATRFVIIYSSNSDEKVSARHVRRRVFTDWIAKNRVDFRELMIVLNKYPFDAADPDNTSRADFYVYERILPLV